MASRSSNAATSTRRVTMGPYSALWLECCLLVTLGAAGPLAAQTAMPDPLAFRDGSPVETAADWELRREEVLELFESEVYGKAPVGQPSWEVVREEPALGELAVRRTVDIHLVGEEAGPTLQLMLYLPRERGERVAVFLGLNFDGNHSIEDDPAIPISAQRLLDLEATQRPIPETAELRGSRAHRWPLVDILERGYGVATGYYGDIDPDHDDGFRNGVHPHFYAAGQEQPAETEWGSIAAWAWGMSRALDYLQSDEDVDGGRVAVLGFSRLGKTALWAGANDPRFGLVISNNSGCGGAALSRRRVGEKIVDINTKFPHWFADRFARYNDREDELPVDQHLLLASIAPRPVYVASASEDSWADFEGEFLAAAAASPVYELLGLEGLGASSLPSPGSVVGGRIGFHLREGRHDLTSWDWSHFLDFADRELRGLPDRDE